MRFNALLFCELPLCMKGAVQKSALPCLYDAFSYHSTIVMPLTKTFLVVFTSHTNLTLII